MIGLRYGAGRRRSATVHRRLLRRSYVGRRRWNCVYECRGDDTGRRRLLISGPDADMNRPAITTIPKRCQPVCDDAIESGAAASRGGRQSRSNNDDCRTPHVDHREDRLSNDVKMPLPVDTVHHASSVEKVRGQGLEIIDQKTNCEEPFPGSTSLTSFGKIRGVPVKGNIAEVTLRLNHGHDDS